MEKKYARLAALLAAAVLCGNGAPSMAAEWWEGDGTETITITADNASEITGDVYGNKDQINPTTGAVTGHVEMTGGTVNGRINGGYSSGGAVTGSTVTITSGSTVENSVYGGYSSSSSYGGEVSGNTVTITGGKVTGDVYGGRISVGAATGNRVTITDGTVNDGIYGGCSSNGGAATGNTVTITGGTVGTVDSSSSVYGGCSNAGAATGNRVTITDGTVNNGIYGGWGYRDATNNRVTITGGTVGTVDSSRSVYGGYSDMGAATGNTVTITGGSTVGGDVYGGYSWNGSGEVSGNTVALSGSADVEKASLYGRNDTRTGYGNTLLINGWSGSTQSVKNFNEIQFQHLSWQKEPVLKITGGDSSDLNTTTIAVEDGIALAGGQTFERGESMTLIQREGGLGDIADLREEKQIQLTAGVTTELAGTLSQKTGGLQDVVLTIDSAQRSGQTDLVGENRAAGAAFVNQGADIAADSLRLLDDGYHFGTQTFGAVYGNRSTYDVASDIKINGWSEIAGFGNIHEVKGGRLAWGVFYENGTGNYRTWNTFNNEMFRGDGSLLYNGGGAAIRLTKDSGMYYEASLRAGTLSSSMSNAVKDGNGNSYGFDSDSTYWGAHLGAGKLIQRGSGQWDIYGKYFHTDIDGDSFEMGGDRFSFDSVTSDRLRLGARYTADTDKAWSLYCGAAYEYEFSGDSRMKAGQFDAPEQSLQGSTVFGEIGTVWGRKDSPWSMDVNLRGYAGEREGFSGMVQLAYAF